MHWANSWTAFLSLALLSAHPSIANDIAQRDREPATSSSIEVFLTLPDHTQHNFITVKDPALSHVEPDRGYDTKKTIHCKLGSCPDLPIRGRGIQTFSELQDALATMQSRLFDVSVGIWPNASDWTAAVIGTYVSVGLSTLTRSLDVKRRPKRAPSLPLERRQLHVIENSINRYFSQIVTYYFGQNAFSIRNQAYDDMLWVVLGWLETLEFLYLQSKISGMPSRPTGPIFEQSFDWYGKQFERSFAHRAHVFYDIARRGWDTRLCGGGMTWDPNLTPYKNAITNELYITASIGMYLYFPGDDNDSPYVDEYHPENLPPGVPHDPRFLNAAIEGYAWLKEVNMTNLNGLYVDGFHVRGWRSGGSNGTGKCDVRNEMVYTYNQGVLLSGLRGLWESTGRVEYLEDSHELVRNVIAATGWHEGEATARPGWYGIGRSGILEELCDADGSCSQDAQTFKGIFFHHLTLFCEPLPDTELIPGKTYAASNALRKLHAQRCREYLPWVAHNAQAALKTKDREGLFGMWWGGGANWRDEQTRLALPPGADDYRNRETHVRCLTSSHTAPAKTYADCKTFYDPDVGQGRLVGCPENVPCTDHFTRQSSNLRDPNSRGRGRTPETQGGGVALLRALHELETLYGPQ